MSGSRICDLCGKTLVLSKEWEESVTTTYGTSVLKYTEHVCPDPVCQEKSEKLLATKQKAAAERQVLYESRQKQRLQQRVKRKEQSLEEH